MKKPINKKKLKAKLKSYFMITVGVALSAFAYVFFLEPYLFDIGGVSGIGVILNYHGMDSSIVIFLINLGLLIIALLLVGFDFFIKNIYGSLMYPVFIKIFSFGYNALVSHYPQVATDIDMVFVALFSSVIMGIGLGLAVRHGGSTGGTEIPQKILYDRLHVPYNLSLYLIDGTIIILGVFFLPEQLSNINLLLGEAIFLITNGIIMDTVIFGGFNRKAVYIISPKWKEIKKALLGDFDRGVTGINVVGEYSNQEKKMLVCVLNTIEYNKLREIINRIDPKAFLYCTKASEVRGEGFTYEADNESTESTLESAPSQEVKKEGDV